MCYTSNWNNKLFPFEGRIAAASSDAQMAWWSQSTLLLIFLQKGKESPAGGEGYSVYL